MLRSDFVPEDVVSSCGERRVLQAMSPCRAERGGALVGCARYSSAPIALIPCRRSLAGPNLRPMLRAVHRGAWRRPTAAQAIAHVATGSKLSGVCLSYGEQFVRAQFSSATEA